MRQPRRTKPHRIIRPQRPAPLESPVEIPDNLYELVFALLGQPDDGSEFTKLVQQIGPPSRQYDIGQHRFYDYYAYGLNFNFYKERNSISHITFHFNTAGVRSGEIHPYRGALPADIAWTDSCLEAEKKLGQKPEKEGWVAGCNGNTCDPKSRASDYWKSYNIDHFNYTLIFESDIGGLAMLSMLLYS